MADRDGDADRLARRFEDHRRHLRALAYHLLGSLAEADDAVQETWLRLSRADPATIQNLGGWLTTVAARICQDMLRARRSRREEPLDGRLPDPVVDAEDGADPEQRALLADSLGLALLVVLDTLSPPERVAYVLHDVFAVPFDQIAATLDRSAAAARQLASRARRRVQGSAAVPDPDLPRQWQAVQAFMAAARAGDFDALLAVLDPEVVLRADLGPGTAQRHRGAGPVAEQALTYAGRADLARRALVNGTAGLVVAAGRQPIAIMAFTITGGRVVELDILADRARLRALPLGPPADRPAG